MEYHDLTITDESKRTESALCAVSGKKFGKESVLTALVPKTPVVLPVGSVNVDQRVVKIHKWGARTKFQRPKIHNTNEDVSFCEQVEGNNMSPTTDDTDRKGSESSEVSFCGQTESNAPPYTISDNTKWGKSSKVSSCEQTTSDALPPTIGDTG